MGRLRGHIWRGGHEADGGLKPALRIGARRWSGGADGSLRRGYLETENGAGSKMLTCNCDGHKFALVIGCGLG